MSLQILQEANDELEEHIKSAEKKLEESTAEMNKMTDEYTKLKVRLSQIHTCLMKFQPARKTFILIAVES